MSFSEIENLIRAEQKRQSDNFIDNEALESYLLKLKSSSETIRYYISEELAGFVAFYCNDKEKELSFITLVLISPKFRGSGLASNLVRFTLESCRLKGFRKCGLQVKNDNLTAISVYQKLGFKIDKETESVLYMIAELQSI